MLSTLLKNKPPNSDSAVGVTKFCWKHQFQVLKHLEGSWTAQCNDIATTQKVKSKKSHHKF